LLNKGLVGLDKLVAGGVEIVRGGRERDIFVSQDRCSGAFEMEAVGNVNQSVDKRRDQGVLLVKRSISCIQTTVYGLRD
jgi:hypothetical protein